MNKLIKNVGASYTHRLEIKVLMADLSARNMEFNFNGWDEWQESGCSPIETACMFYRMITKSFDMDKQVMGWQGKVVNLNTGKEFTAFDPWIKERYRVAC